MTTLSIIADGSYHPPATMYDHFADILTTISLVMIVLFTITYAVFFKFWKRPAGLAIESVFLSLSLFIGYAYTTRISTGGDYPGRDLLRLLVWVLVPASLTFLFVVLVIAWFKSGSPIQAITEVPQREHPGTQSTREDSVDA